MQFVMTVTSKEGKQLHHQKMKVTKNQLNRMHAPELFGERMYDLKKHKKVEIQLADEAVIKYEIFEALDDQSST